MPYIKTGDRIDLSGKKRLPETPGELNHLITVSCIAYLNTKGKSYLVLNEIIGALECAKLEFYRRAVAVYEDKKIKENGDCY